MDMLNADLFLSNDANSKKSNAKESGKKQPEADQEQAGFHFIAFVPIDGGLWKLDGLERQPMNLGTNPLMGHYKTFSNFSTGDYHDEDWMGLARPIIEERMRQYEGEQIQFSLLALCQSPLVTVKNDLSANICTIAAVEKQLQIVQSDWRQFVVGEEFDKALTGPDPSYRITPQSLEAAPIYSDVLSEIANSSIKTERLLELRKQLADSQTQLRTSFVEEATAIQEDDERAATRRHDYTPMVNAWVAALAEKGALKALVNAALEDSCHD
jgi:ubiquitin carboxyl-terminal hydrolase L5